MRTRVLALLTMVLIALGGALAPVQASTGGTPDGNKHPNVGLILFYDADRAVPLLGNPGHAHRAADRRALHRRHAGQDPGDVQLGHRREPAVAVPGRGRPGRRGTRRRRSRRPATCPVRRPRTPPTPTSPTCNNWNDVGVIVLDQPVTGITPATLAPVGTLDAIPTSQLRKTLFTVVGYGTEVRKADSGPQKPQPMSYPLIRRYVDMPGQKVTPQIIQTNGNDKDPFGTGGTCFGDSGGPLFLGNQIVGVTSYTYNNVCRYLGGYQRVDITVARRWLATFGVS